MIPAASEILSIQKLQQYCAQKRQGDITAVMLHYTDFFSIGVPKHS